MSIDAFINPDVFTSDTPRMPATASPHVTPRRAPHTPTAAVNPVAAAAAVMAADVMRSASQSFAPLPPPEGVAEAMWLKRELSRALDRVAEVEDLRVREEKDMKLKLRVKDDLLRKLHEEVQARTSANPAEMHMLRNSLVEAERRIADLVEAASCREAAADIKLRQMSEDIAQMRGVGDANTSLVAHLRSENDELRRALERSENASERVASLLHENRSLHRQVAELNDERSLAAAEGSLEASRQYRQALAQAVKEKHEAELQLSDAEAAGYKKGAAEKEKLETQIAALKERHAQAEDDHRAARDRELEAERARLMAQFQREREDLQAACKRDREADAVRYELMAEKERTVKESVQEEAAFEKDRAKRAEDEVRRVAFAKEKVEREVDRLREDLREAARKFREVQATASTAESLRRELEDVQAQHEREREVWKVTADTEREAMRFDNMRSLDSVQRERDREQHTSSLAMDALRTEIDRRTQDLEAARKQHDANLEDVRAAHQRDLESIREALTRECDTVRDTLTRENETMRDALTRECEATRDRLARERDNVRDTLTRERDALRERLTLECDSTRESLSREIAGLQNTIDENAVRAEVEQKALVGRMEAREKQIQALEDNLAVGRSTIEELERAAAAQHVVVEELKAQLNTAGVDKTTLRAGIDSLTRRKEAAEEQVEQLQKECRKLKVDLSRAKDAVKRLETARNDDEAQLQLDRERERDVLEREREVQSQREGERQAAVEALEATLHKYRREAEAQKQRDAEAITALQQEIDDARTEAAMHRRQAEEHLAQAEAHQRQAELHRREAESFKEEVHVQRQEVEAEKHEVSTQKQVVETCRQEAEALLRQIEALKAAEAQLEGVLRDTRQREEVTVCDLKEKLLSTERDASDQRQKVKFLERDVASLKEAAEKQMKRAEWRETELEAKVKAVQDQCEVMEVQEKQRADRRQAEHDQRAAALQESVEEQRRRCEDLTRRFMDTERALRDEKASRRELEATVEAEQAERAEDIRVHAEHLQNLKAQQDVSTRRQQDLYARKWEDERAALLLQFQAEREGLAVELEAAQAVQRTTETLYLELKPHLHDLQQRLLEERQRGQHEQLQRHVATLEDELQKTTDDLVSAQAAFRQERDGLTEEVGMLKQTLERAASANERDRGILQAEAQRLRDRNLQLTTQNMEAESQLVEMNVELERQRTERVQVGEELETLREGLNMVRSQLHKEREGRQAAQLAAGKNHAQLIAECESLTERLAEAQRSIGDLRQDLAHEQQRNEDTEALKRTLADKDEELASMSFTVAKRLQTTKAKMDTLLEDIETLQADNDTLRKQLRVYESDIAESAMEALKLATGLRAGAQAV